MADFEQVHAELQRLQAEVANFPANCGKSWAEHNAYSLLEILTALLVLFCLTHFAWQWCRETLSELLVFVWGYLVDALQQLDRVDPAEAARQQVRVKWKDEQESS